MSNKQSRLRTPLATSKATRIDLSAIVAQLKLIIASDAHDTPEDAMIAMNNAIESSAMATSVAWFEEIFHKKYYSGFGYTQLTAFDLSLAKEAKRPDMRYLAAARLFSSPSCLLGADIDDSLTRICGIICEDDDSDSRPQPKPRWMLEWGRRKDSQRKP